MGRLILGGRAVGQITKGGQIPRLDSGLDANKSASPGVGDMFYATNTLKTYYCYVAGIWTLISSPAAEKYSNHLGATDTFTNSAVNGVNWTGAADAVNHEFDMSSGATATGYTRFGTKKQFTLGGDSNPLIVNFIINNMVAGTNAAYSGAKFGLSADFQTVLPNNTVAFSWNGTNGVWQTYTINGVAGTTFTNINAINNGDLCTIIGIASKIFFLVNGVVVASHTATIPTAPMFVGAGISAEGGAFSVARSWSVDYYDVVVLR